MSFITAKRNGSLPLPPSDSSISTASRCRLSTVIILYMYVSLANQGLYEITLNQTQLHSTKHL
jgi:hypothetical protein